MSVIRQWPATRPPGAHERLETRCPSCRIRWQVHIDMAGFRLRCECGSWVPVPGTARRRLPVAAQADQLSAPTGSRGTGLVVGDTTGEDGRRFSTGRVQAPGQLRHADVDSRRSWTTRSLIELIALMGALTGPSIVVHMTYVGEVAATAMPIASLASGVLVLLVCTTMGSYSFGGLRHAKPIQFFEALLVACGCAGLALGWSEWLSHSMPWLSDPTLELRQVLGLGWTLFVVGMCPAIFEELAFRGLLQGRMMALLGSRTGILTTAAAFGLAHGMTFGLPLQLGLGIYLGFLRERTGSLYPGMLTHLVYNSLLVILLT